MLLLYGTPQHEVQGSPSLHHAVESAERMTNVRPDRSCPAGMLMRTLFRATFSPPTCIPLVSLFPNIQSAQSCAPACCSAHPLQLLGTPTWSNLPHAEEA